MGSRVFVIIIRAQWFRFISLLPSRSLSYHHTNYSCMFTHAGNSFFHQWIRDAVVFFLLVYAPCADLFQLDVECWSDAVLKISRLRGEVWKKVSHRWLRTNNENNSSFRRKLSSSSHTPYSLVALLTVHLELLFEFRLTWSWRNNFEEP